MLACWHELPLACCDAPHCLPGPHSALLQLSETRRAGHVCISRHVSQQTLPSVYMCLKLPLAIVGVKDCSHHGHASMFAKTRTTHTPFNQFLTCMVFVLMHSATACTDTHAYHLLISPLPMPCLVCIGWCYCTCMSHIDN